MAAINSKPGIARSATPPRLPELNSPAKYTFPDSFVPTEFSKENLTGDHLVSPPQPQSRWPLPSLPLDSPGRAHGAPLSPVHANAPLPTYPRSTARAASFESGDDLYLRQPTAHSSNWELDSHPKSGRREAFATPPPITKTIPYRQRVTINASDTLQQPQYAVLSSVHGDEVDPPRGNPVRPHLPHSRHTSASLRNISEDGEAHQPYDSGPSFRFGGEPPSHPRFRSSKSVSPPLSRPEHLLPVNQHLGIPNRSRAGAAVPRPSSAYSTTSEHGGLARERSPQHSPSPYNRIPSSNSGRSPDSRPVSYIDLINVPYPQPPPAPTHLDNAHLRTAVGNNASLLSTKQTLDMYRANVKKTNDPTIQYEFAVFMVNTAQEAASSGQDQEAQQQPNPKSSRESETHTASSASSQAELIREARHILQRLSERSYPFAQYYLADGYASGLFSKGVEDYDRAYPLFIAASKHGHAEAGYRAALCYEFGWGTRKDPLKAVQFYRQSASKNHPGAMTRLGKACLVGDLGLTSRYREGLKWLKRASESADYQYNSAPYELGLLHETGFGDDVFLDESYAAQLFTQSADLGHTEANYRLGDAYEHGKLSCPRDPALSVHFYTGAAQRSHPLAMMALCAWYMVGAEPVLEKDENEAYEWARKAAETGVYKMCSAHQV